jgi:hypothetical protein
MQSPVGGLEATPEHVSPDFTPRGSVDPHGVPRLITGEGKLL